MKSILEFLKNTLSIIGQLFERKKTEQARDAENQVNKYRDRVRDSNIKSPDEL